MPLAPPKPIGDYFAADATDDTAVATCFATDAVVVDEKRTHTGRDAIAAWFRGSDSAPPDWPGFELLAPARDYPARHGAILLPFDAAIQALEEQAVGA